MADGRMQGARAGLDRERVVRVALELLDEIGLDELTMRRLAERLGVTAASLYWHVRDKDELLALLADAISAEMPLPDPNGPWREELMAYARAVRHVALAHRDAARILAGTLPTGSERLRRIEALFAMLHRAGFRLSDVADAAYLLNVYITGFVLDEVLSPQPAAGCPAESGPGITTALGCLSHGRLHLQHGATNMTIRADPALADLYHLTWEGRPPAVEEQNGTVRIRQRGRRAPCTLTLTGAIPWDITIEGGAWHFTADLTALQLAALRISGGISEATLRLPHATNTVEVQIEGGAHRLRIERPSDTPIRVRLRRGSSRLTLDGLHLGAVGGGTDWESPAYAAATGHYDLSISSGVHELIVAQSEPGTDSSTDHKTVHEHVHHIFAALSPEAYPHLAALSDQLVQPDLDRRFMLGLQIMLDGLERRLHGNRQ